MRKVKKKPKFTAAMLPPGERLVGPEELAVRLDIAHRTLQKWVAMGKVPPPMTLGYKTKRWTETSVAAILQQFAAKESHAAPPKLAAPAA